MIASHRFRLGFSLALLFLPALAAGQGAGDDALGDVSFETSCAPAMRGRFDRAVALLHHMTYARAREEFEAIAEADTGCAMAHWGIAMTLFQPLWPTRPTVVELQRGWQEVSIARRSTSISARERGFIDAAAAFFDPSVGDYWKRIGRWAEAMEMLVRENPSDTEVRAFHALSVLATASTSGGADAQARAATELMTILREHPTHPGANHYLIHADDATGRESLHPEVVHRYASIAPRNAHALHMPTHIYVRLGDWPAVIAGNLLAAAAARQDPAGDRGQWISDEYPHAIEYLVYAYLQMGDDSAATAWSTTLGATANVQPGFKTAFHLSSIPARIALERQDWTTATHLAERPGAQGDGDRFPWPDAITWFARGMGAVEQGDTLAARAAEQRIAGFRAAAERQGEDLFRRQIEILRLELAAHIGRLEGSDAEAIRLLRDAVALESSTPKHAVTPAPTLPAGEMLGRLLLAANRPAEALDACRASLAMWPMRFNGLVCVARAARLAGDSAASASYYATLRRIAAPRSPRAELNETATGRH
jgi:hypothetical protein